MMFIPFDNIRLDLAYVVLDNYDPGNPEIGIINGDVVTITKAIPAQLGVFMSFIELTRVKDGINSIFRVSDYGKKWGLRQIV